MSLWINAEKVTHVLLADGWHNVYSGTFHLDSYEYAEDDTDNALTLHAGGNSGVCATGFTFNQNNFDFRICGPLTAILAIKEDIRDL